MKTLALVGLTFLTAVSISTLAQASPIKLTSADIVELAARAALAAGEDRIPQDGQCMTTAKSIKCNWTLPTNYSDDELNAVFSIDGTVLDVQIEPGC